jgi:hypothetical protein
MVRPVRFHSRKEWTDRHNPRKNRAHDEEKSHEEKTCHQPLVYVLSVIFEEENETTERNLRTDAISNSKYSGLSRSPTTSNLHNFYHEALMRE